VRVLGETEDSVMVPLGVPPPPAAAMVTVNGAEVVLLAASVAVMVKL